ncbi:MAG: hypothetical protein IPM79_26675 [Polyangiaceae bacterium]|nr:hypothetical protein [Polyangiaceae bacterium]MBK8941101.1 hypothetical protein [Polyangiaceae bacterium]
MSAAKKPPKGDGLLPKELVESWSKIGYGLGALGVAAFAAGMLGADQARFGAAYLVGFMFTTTIAVGALFFVVIQHLTKAGWSVAPRRIMEWLSQGLIASAVLFVPLVVMAPKIWHHWMGEHAAHDQVLVQKQGYLNQPFFYARAIVFLVVWALLATWFYKLSREQDSTGDRKLSDKLQVAAAPSIAALGLTISFAGFDWVMSLDPHWYSTIFGVYIFAGCLLSSHAMLALCIVRLRKDNIGGNLLTVEHQHDVGKFLFGFVVFWAYIGFSQFMLIFYANIPEETVWYLHRWNHGWHVVSMGLFLLHFIAPFLMLLSRTAKRDPRLLAAGAGLLLFMHWVDLYWLVMPNFDEHFHFQWVDIAGLLAPVGVTAAWLSKRVLADPVYPLKDPYIPEALKAENL